MGIPGELHTQATVINKNMTSMQRKHVQATETRGKKRDPKFITFRAMCSKRNPRPSTKSKLNADGAQPRHFRLLEASFKTNVLNVLNEV